MTPVYETTANILAQREVAEWLAAHWRMDVRHTARFARWDCELSRSGLLLYRVEVKCRQSEHWPLYLTAAKWDVLQRLDADDTRSLLVYRLPRSGLLAMRVHDALNPSRGMFGRRGRPEEMCVQLPREWFGEVR